MGSHVGFSSAVFCTEPSSMCDTHSLSQLSGGINPQRGNIFLFVDLIKSTKKIIIIIQHCWSSPAVGSSQNSIYISYYNPNWNKGTAGPLSYITEQQNSTWSRRQRDEGCSDVCHFSEIITIGVGYLQKKNMSAAITWRLIGNPTCLLKPGLWNLVMKKVWQ